MPYPGVPKHLIEKMESCVSRVMSQGHDKSSAIAICHNSIVKNSLPLFVEVDCSVKQDDLVKSKKDK